MRRALLACLLLIAAAPAAPRVALPVVEANDNRTPAGRLRDGVLTLDLVVVMARWYPEANDGPFVELPVFAEEGKAPTIPGPLVRVPVGTRIRLSVRNALADSSVSLLGYGITKDGDTTGVTLAPNERREFMITASQAGTFLYGAHADYPASVRMLKVFETEQLAGAVVVDAPGDRRDDRVFVLNIWSGMRPDSSDRNALAINGKSWPYTERFHATVGDTLRWRVVNATDRIHPMHLHGAYFRVDARGAPNGDTSYTSAQRRMSVTELMEPRTTMRMTWSPETPGNWLFHCHLAFHVIGGARLDAPEGGEHDMHSTDPAKHMAGLVIGIDVKPHGKAVERKNVRRISVVIAPGIAKDTSHMRPIALRLSPDGRPPTPAEIRPRGDLLLLTRGQPTDITVHNALSEPTAIHWHGLELESWSDGVAGFSGSGSKLAPSIAPSDSFVARLTLKRAGTFIYHTHLNDLYQIASGLYGPLVVLEPGQVWDPARDLVVTVGYDITKIDGPWANGGETEPPFAMRVGRPVRMRFINIQPADPVTFEVIRDSTVVQWRPLAKDGFDLPKAQAAICAAKRLLAVGETFDAEFAPSEPGVYVLRVRDSPKSILYERRLEVGR